MEFSLFVYDAGTRQVVRYRNRKADNHRQVGWGITALIAAGIATQNNVSKEKLRAIIMPPESEPTIAPQCVHTAFDRPRPSPGFCGVQRRRQSIARPGNRQSPMPVPKIASAISQRPFRQAYHDNANRAQRSSHRQYPERLSRSINTRRVTARQACRQPECGSHPRRLLFLRK